MPTTRARHVITETDGVSAALRDAALAWPADSGTPTKLLLHLVAEGHRVVRAQREQEAAERRAAIDRTAGSLTGVYGPGYLDDLRADWPE